MCSCKGGCHMSLGLEVRRGMGGRGGPAVHGGALSVSEQV